MSCDNDKYVKESIFANYYPENFFSNILTRKLSKFDNIIKTKESKHLNSKKPQLDLYVCGFPCQSFSNAGNKMAMNDPRGNIMKKCIKTIFYTTPKVFILENVKNFKTIDNGKAFKYLYNKLNTGLYNIYVEILNTRNYGLPQNRERIFIIGIRKDVQMYDFYTPPHKKMKKLSQLFKKNNLPQIKPTYSLKKNIIKVQNYKKKNNLKNTEFIILPFNYYYPIPNVSPSLLTNSSQFYTRFKRYLTPQECLLLQGFKTSFNQVVSNSQMYKQIGNSMSVNVLKELYKVIFSIVNFN